MVSKQKRCAACVVYIAYRCCATRKRDQEATDNMHRAPALPHLLGVLVGVLVVLVAVLATVLVVVLVLRNEGKKGDRR